MKSKTSCFNATILKKNVTHYWPLWVLYTCYLLFMLPVNLWISITQTNNYYDTVAEKKFYIVSNALDNGLFPIPIFLFSVIVALAVFSYLYSAKNANMIHALPVNRFELYVTNYISGFLFLTVPEILTFVTSVLVCVANQVTCIQYLFYWLVYILGITFFAYSLAVFVAMFTGQIFALPVYYLILNYLYVGGLYIGCMLLNLISYGISDYWNPGKSCILSPIYYLGNNLRTELLYEGGDRANRAIGIQMKGGYLVAIYAAAAVVLVIVAYWLYKHRRIETAGDLISIGIVKPIFRWGAALYGGIWLSVIIMQELVYRYRGLNSYAGLAVSVLVLGFIFFFVAEMFLQKSFRVFRKKRILEWCACSVVTIALISLFQADVFGMERFLPEEDEIEKAFVFMDYPLEVDEDRVGELLEMHREVIASKKEYLENAKGWEGFYYTTFRYYLKDGSVVERYYPMPVTDEYRADNTSPTAKLLSWESETDNLMDQILGIKNTENVYYGCNVELYAENGEMNNYSASREEMGKIIGAVRTDIEEGNFNAYYIQSKSADIDEMKSYMNGLIINYYNSKAPYNMWTYYDNYRDIVSGDRRRGVQYGGDFSNYINIGPDCVNTVKVLKELGIVNDTWKLFTYDEYAKYIE